MSMVLWLVYLKQELSQASAFPDLWFWLTQVELSETGTPPTLSLRAFPFLPLRGSQLPEEFNRHRSGVLIASLLHSSNISLLAKVEGPNEGFPFGLVG